MLNLKLFRINETVLILIPGKVFRIFGYIRISISVITEKKNINSYYEH